MNKEIDLKELIKKVLTSKESRDSETLKDVMLESAENYWPWESA